MDVWNTRRSNGDVRSLRHLLVCWALLLVAAVVVSMQPNRPANAAAESIVPLTPSRLLETRVGPSLTTSDGQYEGVGRVSPGATVEFVVAGRGKVPTNAVAVLLNVTAVAPSAAGFLTVWACGQQRPVPASNVNYAAGDISPNAVLAAVGSGGKVCVYSLAATDVVVDVNGYVPPGGSLAPTAPARFLETRRGPNDRTFDRQFEGVGRVEAGEVVEVEIAGRGSVPTDAAAVLLNVTAVGAVAPGYLTVFPCGAKRPDPASNVNYLPGGAYPNAVLSKIGAGGKVCIYSLVAVEVIVDVNGFVEFGSSLVASVPQRMLETRVGDTNTTFDGRFQGGGRLGAGKVIEVQIAGRGSVPAGATTVVMNLTAVGATAPGFLTAYPCDRTRPEPASNVNYLPGGAYPNAVVSQLSGTGTVCLYTLAETHLIIDVVGSVGGAGTGIDLSTVTVASGTRRPLDRIAVTGLDLGDDLSGFAVQLMVDGVRYGSLPVWVDEAGPYVTAPFHPVHPATRGTIELVPSDGDRPGKVATIDLRPLPSAPGAWNDAIAAMKARLAGEATAVGSSIAIVRSTAFASLSPRLAMIKMLDQWIDDGTNDDLGSLYAGTRTITADERALVDAVTAQLGLGGGMLSSSASMVDAVEPTINSGRLVESTNDCRESPVKIEPDDPEALVEAMELGVEAKGETEGAQRQALEELADFMGAAQYIPGALGDAADLISSFITISYVFDLMDYFENPTKLTALTIEGTTSFNEDFQSPGELARVNVTAESVGGSLERAFAEAMTELVAIIVGGLLPSAQDPITELVVRNLINIGKEALKDRLDDPRDAVPICPGIWVVDINDPEYIDLKSALGRLDVSTSSNAFRYEPNRLADDRLIVTARPEKFRQRSATGQLPVIVKPIQIILTPDPTFIASPTTAFDLKAEVLNADNPALEWTTPRDTLTTTGAEPEVTIQYSALDTPSFPHVVSVRSTSTSGLRGKPGAPPRTASTTVNVSGIRIVPDNQQLQVGDDVDFDVVDVEDAILADDLVEWDADGGSIDANGVYTAGNTPGTYAVTAVLKADPSKVAVTSVTISDECTVGSWGLQVQRYLDDLNAYGIAEYGIDNPGTYQTGFERMVISPDVPGDTIFYPTFEVESSLTVSFAGEDGTTDLFETRGVDSGELDPDEGTATLYFFTDEPGIERRSTIAGEAQPWLPGPPLAPVSSGFPVLYICGQDEMAIGGDLNHPVVSYWTRQ